MNQDSGTNRDNLTEIWGPAGHREALRQVADLCRKELSLNIDVASDGSSLRSTKGDMKDRDGILSISGQLSDDSIITLRMELIRGREDIKVSSSYFFKHLSELGNKVRLCRPKEERSGELSLWVELDIKAEPMSMTRETTLLSEIRRINELSKTLGAELPLEKDNAQLATLYNNYTDLQPVYPLDLTGNGCCPDMLNWSREIADFLAASVNVAVSSPVSTVLDYAMAAIAGELMRCGDSLGLVISPSVAIRAVPEIMQKAPARVVIPAMKISMGANLYEMGKEVETLLPALSSMNKPAIFTGTLEQLQSVFHGGQGGVNDPLFPVIRHVPEIPLDELVSFAVRSAGRQAGGLSRRTEKEIRENILSELRCLGPAGQRRILPVVVKKMVHASINGSKREPASQPFAARVAGLTETLAGLSPRPRVSRLPEVQERFVAAMTDPGLANHFKDHLMAQDFALEQLASRLSMEALTRPLHQPIRYCAQGTPATGKSETAVLLARRLDIPYINIDAASMPDYHTAASQLLGSGRGIVMSYQAGRLEQAAKHHAGVVVEVSDLDHAAPSVRAMLADLFLQVLETGEAQSAAGSMFSCANVIFAFTMNLPDGADEAVRKGIGFNNVPSKDETSRRVVSEIKAMLSGAFLSRIGTPILFEPLDGEAMAVVAERAVKSAILSAAERMNIRLQRIEMEEGVGSTVICSLKASVVSFGARAILEHGRTLAARAFMEFYARQKDLTESIMISATAEGKIVINSIAAIDKGENQDE